jgi:hypothetical protein
MFSTLYEKLKSIVTSTPDHDVPEARVDRYDIAQVNQGRGEEDRRRIARKRA